MRECSCMNVVCVHSQADKLLSPEFQPVIEQLIAHVKPDRQILLYSATFPVTVKQFKDKFLNKPYIVNLMEELTLKGITQVLLGCRLHFETHLLQSCEAFVDWFLDQTAASVTRIVRSFCSAVLCLCGGEAEGPLLEHSLLQGVRLPTSCASAHQGQLCSVVCAYKPPHMSMPHSLQSPAVS